MAQDDYDPHPRPVPGPSLLAAMEYLRASRAPARRDDARDDVRDDSGDNAPDDCGDDSGPAPAPGAYASHEPSRDPSHDPSTFDHAAALREYLLLLDNGIKYSLGADRYDKVASYGIAPRLIKSSLEIAGWLKQMSGEMPERGADRRFTQRIIVEHVSARPALGPVPAQILKTIPGGSPAADPQDIDAMADAMVSES